MKERGEMEKEKRKKEGGTGRESVIWAPLKKSFTALNRRFFFVVIIDFLFIVTVFLLIGGVTALLRRILDSYKYLDPVIAEMQSMMGKLVPTDLESLEIARGQLDLLNTGLDLMILKLALLGVVSFIVFCFVFAVFKGYSWRFIKSEELKRHNIIRMSLFFVVFYLIEILLIAFSIFFLNDKAGYYVFFGVFIGFMYLQWMFFIVYNNKKKMRDIILDIIRTGLKGIGAFVLPVLFLCAGVILGYTLFNILVKIIASLIPLTPVVFTWVYGIGILLVFIFIFVWFKYYLYQASKMVMR